MKSEEPPGQQEHPELDMSTLPTGQPDISATSTNLLGNRPNIEMMQTAQIARLDEAAQFRSAVAKALTSVLAHIWEQLEALKDRRNAFTAVSGVSPTQQMEIKLLEVEIGELEDYYKAAQAFARLVDESARRQRETIERLLTPP
jgi:hypothetical protein